MAKRSNRDLSKSAAVEVEKLVRHWNHAGEALLKNDWPQLALQLAAAGKRASKLALMEKEEGGHIFARMEGKV